MVTELRQDCLRRQKSAHLIEERECSSWPTAQASDHVTKRTSKSWKEKGAVNFCLSNPEILEKNWLTPTANENEQDVEKFIKRMEKYPNGTTMPSLSNQVKSWATPNTMDHMEQRSPEALQKQFQTTRKGRTQPANLREQIIPENWPTPAQRDYKGANSTEHITGQTASARGHMGQLPNAVAKDGLPALGSPNTTGKNRGSLNADWTESLMGIPLGWTQLPKSWIVGKVKNTCQQGLTD
jgi:hypothetical protein